MGAGDEVREDLDGYPELMAKLQERARREIRTPQNMALVLIRDALAEKAA